MNQADFCPCLQGDGTVEPKSDCSICAGTGKRNPARTPAETTRDLRDEKLIEHMVRRFLGWHLPDSFCPDGGISFDRAYYQSKPYPMPIGTNLLTHQQATEMVRYMLEGSTPASDIPPTCCCYCGEGDSDHDTCKKAVEWERRRALAAGRSPVPPPDRITYECPTSPVHDTWRAGKGEFRCKECSSEPVRFEWRLLSQRPALAPADPAPPQGRIQPPPKFPNITPGTPENVSEWAQNLASDSVKAGEIEVAAPTQATCIYCDSADPEHDVLECGMQREKQAQGQTPPGEE